MKFPFNCHSHGPCWDAGSKDDLVETMPLEVPAPSSPVVPSDAEKEREEIPATQPFMLSSPASSPGKESVPVDPSPKKEVRHSLNYIFILGRTQALTATTHQTLICSSVFKSGNCLKVI